MTKEQIINRIDELILLQQEKQELFQRLRNELNLKQQEALQKQKEKFKNKDFKTLSTKEKDELLYLALKQLGLIDQGGTNG